MAVFALKNTFLCLQAVDDPLSRRRAYSEQVIRMAKCDGPQQQEFDRLSDVSTADVSTAEEEEEHEDKDEDSRLRILTGDSTTFSNDSSLPFGQVPKDSKHCLVPKLVNLEEEYAKSLCGGQAITTVMIRNIPNRCSQQELMDELAHVGLRGCFDFLYIPLDIGTMGNLGYSFVNFTDPSHAARCLAVFPNHKFKKHRKITKSVVVVAAHMQGLEANLRHYEKCAVSRSRIRQRRPIVLTSNNEAFVGS